jgi:hypothetical protein
MRACCAASVLRQSLQGKTHARDARGRSYRLLLLLSLRRGGQQTRKLLGHELIAGRVRQYGPRAAGRLCCLKSARGVLHRLLTRQAWGSDLRLVGCCCCCVNDRNLRTA